MTHQMLVRPGTSRSPGTGSPDTRSPDALPLESLRAALEEQRTFRIDQLVQLHRPGAGGPLSSTVPEIVRELEAGARAALRDVSAALWRMDEGSYGRCVTCGRPVERERLEVLPHVAHCLPCQRTAGR